MAKKAVDGRQESVSSSNEAASSSSSSRKKPISKKRSASSPGSQSRGKRERSATAGTKRSTASSDTQRQNGAARASPSAKQDRKKAEAKEAIQDVEEREEREAGELTVATPEEDGTGGEGTGMGHNDKVFDGIEKQLNEAFAEVASETSDGPALDVIRHYIQQGYTKPFEIPVSCIKSGCKSESTTISLWIAHVQKRHPNFYRILLKIFLEHKVVKACRHGCGQSFVNVAMHESKCAQNTVAAATQLHAQVAIGSVSSWLKNGPHWDIITKATATSLVRRGVRLTQELRGKMPREIMSLMASYQKQRNDIGLAKVRMMQIIMIPNLLLNIKRGKPLKPKVFNDRLKRFKCGEWKGLVHEALANIKWNQQDEANQEQFEQLKGSLQSLISHGKAAMALKDQNQKAILSRRVLEKDFVPSQFPKADPVEYGPREDYKNEHRTKVSPSVMYEAIRKLQFTPGVSGTTVQFWQQLAKQNYRVVLTIVQDVVDNNLPCELMQILSGTHQTVLAYSDKPGKYRGVGSSDALIKIAAQCLLMTHEKKIEAVAKQSPDMAVGKPAGMERLIHRIRQKFDVARDEALQDYAFLQIDVKGAFPNTKRKELRQAIQADLPQFLPIFDSIYGNPNIHDVLTNDSGLLTIRQCDGIIQGNELSTLFFMIYIKRILSKVDADNVLDMMSQYVDDMIIYGKIEDVEELFHKVSAELEKHNLKLSKSKCNLWMPMAQLKDADVVADRLGVESASHGLTVLGVPVGKDNWTLQILKDQASHFKNMVQRLGDQGVSLQHRNKVLQYIPSYFQHVISTTPPTLLKDFVQTVDQQADLQFRRMFYTDYSENDFTKKLQGGENAPTVANYINKRMTLPMRLGGMGILSLDQRYSRAYGISLARFIHLSGSPSQTQLDQLNAIKAACGWQGKRTDEIARMKVSQECSHAFNKIIDGIMNDSPMKVRQAMLASKSKGTANIIKTQPWVKATTLNNQEFTFAVRYRMGIGAEKLFKIQSNPDGSLPVCKACTANQPLTLEHAFSCTHIKIKQHNFMVKQVEQMLVAAGRKAQLEVTNPQDTDNTRPDIITDNDDAQAGITQTALDFTSTTAYRDSDTQLPDKAGKAMERIARGKHAKYQQYAADNGSKFVPLAMDNHGAIHKEFADFITATAKIAEKRLLFIPKVDLHFKTLWSHVFSCSIIKLYYANVCTLVQKLQN